MPTSVQTWECVSAFTSLGTDPAALTCLNIEQLLPMVTAIPTNASVVPIITNWLTCVCCQPACNNYTITAIHNLLKKKCPADDWAMFDPVFYPTFRKSDCFKKFAFPSFLRWSGQRLIYSP